MDENLKKQIHDMRQFLMLCGLTGYILDDQIELLNRALDALEREALNE